MGYMRAPEDEIQEEREGEVRHVVKSDLSHSISQETMIYMTSVRAPRTSGSPTESTASSSNEAESQREEFNRGIGDLKQIIVLLT